MTLPTDAAARKAMPMLRFLTTYFPDAIEELVKLCVQGNIQHNPDRAPEDIVWARDKSTDQLECTFRHLWDHCRGTPVDVDGRYHLGKTAWRALAALQLQIEADREEITHPQLEIDLVPAPVRGAIAVDAAGEVIPDGAETVECHMCGTVQRKWRDACIRCGIKMVPPV